MVAHRSKRSVLQIQVARMLPGPGWNTTWDYDIDHSEFEIIVAIRIYVTIFNDSNINPHL